MVMSDDADPLAWRPRKAPSLAEFEVLAGEVFARLPRKFRELCDGLVIRIDDFPTDEVLDDMDIESEFGLLGCFMASACRSARRAPGADAEHDLALPPADPRLLGPSMTRRSARSSPTCWCTRSAIISASPTTTSRGSSRRRAEAPLLVRRHSPARS